MKISSRCIVLFLIWMFGCILCLPGSPLLKPYKRLRNRRVCECRHGREDQMCPGERLCRPGERWPFPYREKLCFNGGYYNLWYIIMFTLINPRLHLISTLNAFSLIWDIKHSNLSHSNNHTLCAEIPLEFRQHTKLE